MIYNDNDTEQFFQNMSISYPELMERSTIDTFNVGPGWFNIINVLLQGICSRLYRAEGALAYIEKYIDNNGANEETIKYLIEYRLNYEIAINALPIIIQVNETYGDLHFYVNGGDSRCNDLIAFAESIASYTCSICGKPAQGRQIGQFSVLCDNHIL